MRGFRDPLAAPHSDYREVEALLSEEERQTFLQNVKGASFGCHPYEETVAGYLAMMDANDFCMELVTLARSVLDSSLPRMHLLHPIVCAVHFCGIQDDNADYPNVLLIRRVRELLSR
jgi:hypothetical protein